MTLFNTCVRVILVQEAGYLYLQKYLMINAALFYTLITKGTAHNRILNPTTSRNRFPRLRADRIRLDL